LKRLKLSSLGIKYLLNATTLFVLTLSLSQCFAHAGQENASYSAPALFNQANALARDGKIGPAMLLYERARLLAPSDADVAANEHFLRARAGLPDAPENRFERLFNFASPDSFAWLGCIGLLMMGTSVMMMRLHPKWRRCFSATTAAGVVSVLFAFGSAVFTWPKMNEAIVIAHESPARVSPANVAETSFKLREGEMVAVSAEGGEFVLVQAAMGRAGWVARADLARVVPQ
jgi:hypothetical protein